MSVLRYAMLGGAGADSIGELHRNAARTSGIFKLVAGCFSRDLTRNAAFGQSLGLNTSRLYANVQALLHEESLRDDGARWLFVCTPHADHAASVVAALNAGWNVMAEKPLCTQLTELQEIEAAAAPSPHRVRMPLVLRYMPPLQRMRSAIHSRRIGSLQKIRFTWLQGRRVVQHNVEADWRFVSQHAGPAGTLADLGTHALDLCSWLGGGIHEIVSAQLFRMDKRHELDDHVALRLSLFGNAKADLMLSQSAPISGVGAKVVAQGTEGYLTWDLSSPMSLSFSMRPSALNVRPVIAHEAVLESAYALAFGDFYRDIAAAASGLRINCPAALTNLTDGIHGVRWIGAVLRHVDNQSNQEKIDLFSHYNFFQEI